VQIDCIVASNDLLGECPLWCNRTQRRWWADVLNARLHCFDPRTRDHGIYSPPFRRLGSIAFRQTGGLVLATERGLFSFDPEDGQTRLLVEVEPGKPTHRLNDGRCDRSGRFWVGSMSDGDLAPVGSLFRIGVDLDVKTMVEHAIIPNSIAFSPDDRTLYFADTRQFKIWAYSFDLAAGIISDRRVFADMGGWRGRPDGSCVDEDGFLWNASYAGGTIIRFDPNGVIDREIELPVSHPTCCCFGGSDFSTLFVTSARFPLSPAEAAMEPQAGGVFAIETSFRGLPEAMFGS
jgi:sugar lactone lactonase YvrE